MKIITAILSLMLVMWAAGQVYGQKNFRDKFHAFKFELHDMLDRDHPMRVSPTLAMVIETFLNDNEQEIVNFRIDQLKEYERDPVDDLSDFEPLPESEMQKIRQQALLLSTEKSLMQMMKDDNVNQNLKGLEDINDVRNLAMLLKLQAASPMEVITMVHSQMLAQTFYERLDFTPEEVTRAFARLGIAGMHLSTKKEDKINWVVTVNSYHVLGQYHVNVNTGEITILKVLTRKK